MADYLAIDGYKDSSKGANDRYYTIDLSEITGEKITKLEQICEYTSKFKNEQALLIHLMGKTDIPDRYIDGKHHFVICYDGRGNNKGKIIVRVKSNTSTTVSDSKVPFKDEPNILSPGVLRDLILSNVIPSYQNHDYTSEDETLKIANIKKIIDIAKDMDGYNFNDNLRRAVSELESYLAQIEKNRCSDSDVFYRGAFHLYHSLCCDNKMERVSNSIVKQYKTMFPYQSNEADDEVYPINKTKAFNFGIEYIVYLKQMAQKVQEKHEEKEIDNQKYDQYEQYEQTSLFDIIDKQIKYHEEEENWDEEYISFYKNCIANDELPITYEEWRNYFKYQRIKKD